MVSPVAHSVHPLVRRLYMEPQPWVLRPAAPTDDEAVAAFLTDGFLHPFIPAVTRGFLRWLLRGNPAGDGVGWTAEVDGRLVGYGSWLPCRVRRPGGEVRAHKIGPLCVRPEWRNQGLFLHLTDAALGSVLSPDAPLAFSLGSAAPVTKGLCKFLGCQVALELREHVVPLRPDGLSDARLPRLLRSPVAKTVVATLLQLGTVGRATALRVVRGRGVTVGRAETVDPAFDAFLQSAMQGYQWVVVRDRRYLEWRYLQNPRHRYDFYVARRGRRICGYMVLNLNHEREGIIVDLLTAHGDGGAYMALLAAAVGRFARERARSIRMYQQPEYWANRGVRQILPFVRPNAIALAWHSHAGQLAAPTPDQVGAWHVCLGDTDDEGGPDQRVERA